MCTKRNIFGALMINNEYIRGSFLFEGVRDEVIDKCLANSVFEIIRYHRKDPIYTPSSFEHKIGIILEGKCRVNRLRCGCSPLPLNTLYPGDSFGVLAMFTGREEFPTEIVAEKDSVIAYISQESFEKMILLSGEISLNVIRFLANRINFLCDKVSSFSSDNVEQKLARYLVSLSQSTGCHELKFNKKAAAESLNTGRTSLYRALQSFAENGIIKINEKTITILDYDSLERITK